MLECVEPGSSLSRSELRSSFIEAATDAERVGIEVESAILNPVTGASIPYEGSRGIRVYLETIQAQFGGTVCVENGNLLGLGFPDGSSLSLEHGGAIEYSSSPCANATGAVGQTYEMYRRLAAVADDLDLALVPGGNFPFTGRSDVSWVPHLRGPIMRGYFRSLGAAGSHGPDIMSRTLSTQVTFDYSDEDDLIDKLGMQSAVSTFATAMFVNSPLESGQVSQSLSRRMDYWAGADARRTGIIPPALTDSLSIDALVDWSMSQPLMYRRHADGRCSVAPTAPFGSLLASGFGDGTYPDVADWRSHLTQVISDVRVRRTLEIRAMDGPSFETFSSVPAFWTGLTYDASARRQAWELVGEFTRDQHTAARLQIAKYGTGATIAGQPIKTFLAELLQLSRQGLTTRVKDGVENPAILTWLDPLFDIVETGRTMAHVCRDLWQNAFSHDVRKYIDFYRVR
ncbi:glutamate-cysteine ligase family protein [Actinoplanes rectilineatus]|uniref:glutamate-cysteine ligase family protein n=1 Tax=Actinoplanes rectilineatus TaxID=113571 RepID=UPI000B06B38B|nr:glutamate-cysteine ligase family protein [Actinoplanes rectilineatus]